MNKYLPLRYRQVHLDFHTGPAIRDVGRDFDARAFAKMVKEAHINSITIFAKCHHGHLYYNTRRPERHPGLAPGLDLLGEQVEALHREGIRAPIYISVQCDEYAANTHPEWVARNLDSSQVKWAGEPKVFGAGWQILDMSSPYQDFCAEQTAEVLKLFKPVDGIFFDMCWDQPSTTQWAIDGMRKANLNPETAEDRAVYARQVAHTYMKRYFDMVRASSKEATVFFNSRPFTHFAQESQWQTQAEIEALPTGGWGYLYFPKNVRFVRNFGMPYMGMTARFHKSWADFGGLKPEAALEYEVSQMIAHGAKCSIGDQMHPRGTLDKAAYALIGKVYKRVLDREQWLDGATPMSQIGLFQRPTASTEVQTSSSATDEGAVRMLTQLKHQFDVVSVDSELEKYDLLILPDGAQSDEKLLKRLRAYVKRGGRLLCSGHAGLNEQGSECLLPELGIKPMGESPFTTTYIRFGNEVSADVPPTDHVMYERSVRVMAANGARVLAKVVEPYFERAWDHFSSHKQTPPDKVSRYAAAVRNGNCAYIGYPIFDAFAHHANQPYRLLVRNVLNLLLPEPLVKLAAPTSTEVTVQRQGARTIVHLLQYCAERRGDGLDLIEDVVPLYDVALSLKLPKAPRKVYLAPEGKDVPFEYAAGRVSVRIPELRGHAMVVFE